MRCANCDAEIPDKSLYCDICGNAVEVSATDETADKAQENADEENAGEENAAEESKGEQNVPDATLVIPAIHTSQSWVTVNPPSRPIQPRLDLIIVIGIGIIGVAVAILILLGGARFVLSLLS